MAKNIVRYGGNPQYNLDVGAGVVSGDAVEIGPSLHGTAITDADGNNNATVILNCDYIATFDVTGADDAAGAAISIGDTIYFDSADGEINVDSVNGNQFGAALEAVGSGNTENIRVAVGAR